MGNMTYFEAWNKLQTKLEDMPTVPEDSPLMREANYLAWKALWSERIRIPKVRESSYFMLSVDAKKHTCTFQLDKQYKYILFGPVNDDTRSIFRATLRRLLNFLEKLYELFDESYVPGINNILTDLMQSPNRSRILGLIYDRYTNPQLMPEYLKMLDYLY